MILHRPIPDGFKIKTAAIIKKVDGYYITLSLQDATVPVLTADAPDLNNTIGIDMGLKSPELVEVENVVKNAPMGENTYIAPNAFGFKQKVVQIKASDEE